MRFNQRAEIVLKRLKDFGASVISFVDKNKKGHNIISSQELESLPNKDDVCIYVCMQNAMQHEITADMLFKMGFHYIIFLPVSDKYNMQAYKMVELWNHIYEEGVDSSLNIPRYESFIREDKRQQENVLYVPMELVFAGGGSTFHCISHITNYTDISMKEENDFRNIYKKIRYGEQKKA